MKFLIQLIVIGILAFVLELFLPWWSIAIAAFIGGIAVPTRANFMAGFLGIALFWFLYALIIHTSAAAPLTDRVARIFSVNSTLLLVITATIGGLVGGFAAMAGGALRTTQKRRDDRYYR